MMHFIQIKGNIPLAKAGDLHWRAVSPLYFVNTKSHTSPKGAPSHIEILARRKVTS